MTAAVPVSVEEREPVAVASPKVAQQGQPEQPTAMQRVVSQRVTAQFDPSESYEAQLERAVHVAQEMFGVAAARLTLFDRTYEWKRDSSAASYRHLSTDEFVLAAAEEPGMFLVVDASRDERFDEHPGVVGEPGIRFYASAPIFDMTGTRAGALRLVDTVPRVLTEPERFILQQLAHQVEKEAAHQQELEQVSTVQRSLAPRPLKGVDGYELGGSCLPSRAVGGDFYDWYLTRSGNIVFTLGDVMGKGIGAAIIAATVRGVMRSGARKDRIGPTLDAAADALDTDMDGAPGFVTLFHARLEVSTGTVSYVDAGHGLTLLIDGNKAGALRLGSTNLPLGIQPEGEWDELCLTIPPGGSLVAVSDGVLDFVDGSLVALDQVEAIVREAPSAQAAADEIVRRAGEGAGDDVTALVIRRKPE